MTPADEDALVQQVYAYKAAAEMADDDLLKFAIRAAYAKGREDAAKAVDKMARGYCHGLTRHEFDALTDAAAAIRRGE